MNGAQTLVRTLADSGLSVCFANPGTSEMHFVAALDAEPRMRGILCLQEGVVAGAADGYARMTGTPAAALLHLGPGFANAISFLHNARKARAGIVSIVGDQLAEALDARADADTVTLVRPGMPAAGALTPDTMGAIMARLLPDNPILSDDSLTAGPGMQKHLITAPAHDALFLTGGAIGDAAPMAIGAAIAAPDRKVIAVSGDGAAMYSLPALWTMAREKLDIVTIICANRSYNILNVELARVGAGDPGPKTRALLDLHDPVPDWVKLAQGMGVAATRAETTTAFAAQFAAAMTTPGPHLIEAVLQQ